MPASATITSFYTFQGNTRARATQVNNNFSIFRGHIVPVDPNTAAAADITYDLGSSEYAWRTGYFRAIDLRGDSSTGEVITINNNISIQEDSNGDLSFVVGGETSTSIGQFGVAAYGVEPLIGNSSPNTAPVLFFQSITGATAAVFEISALAMSFVLKKPRILKIGLVGIPDVSGSFGNQIQTGGLSSWGMSLLVNNTASGLSTTFVTNPNGTFAPGQFWYYYRTPLADDQSLSFRVRIFAESATSSGAFFQLANCILIAF